MPIWEAENEVKGRKITSSFNMAFELYDAQYGQYSGVASPLSLMNT